MTGCSDSDLFFVYGTLLRGFGNHGIMRKIGGCFLGEAVSVTAFPLVVTDLPYLLDRAGEGFRVEGELYRIPVAGWKTLDRLEGHPHFYRRRIETFELGGGGTVAAWVYFLARKDIDLRGVKPIPKFTDAGDGRMKSKT